jgi:hypothetical protein
MNMEPVRQPKKAERKILRKLAALAYERELTRCLSRLESSFADWRAGRIGVAQLNHSIHDYHDGDSRDLWKKYNGLSPEELVGIAVAEGILEQDDVPDAVCELVTDWADRIRMLRKRP